MFSIILTRMFSFASRALFVYDYLLTLDWEVEYFWHTRLTRATLIFFANRYTSMAVVVIDMLVLLVGTESNLICNALEMSLAAGFILEQVILALFATLRIYAIVDRKRILPIVVFLLSMLSPALFLFTYVGSVGITTQPLYRGCILKIKLSIGEYNTAIIISRSCIVFCDFLVVSTVFRVVGFPWARPRLSSRISPVTVSLLKSSIAFFLALLLLNVAQIVSMLIGYTISVAAFLSPLTSILITRMLMSLRRANRLYDDDFLSLFVRDISPVHFASGEPGELRSQEYEDHIFYPDSNVRSSYPHINLSDLRASRRRVLDTFSASPI